MLPLQHPSVGFTFRTGREDCADSPYSDATLEFPSPTMTGEDMFGYYAREDGPGFGLSEAEVMG